MLAVNEQGNLVRYSFPPLQNGQAYCFCHRRRGKIIGRLFDQDHYYYYIVLLVKVQSTTFEHYPGEFFMVRKSLVYAIEHE